MPRKRRFCGDSSWVCSAAVRATNTCQLVKITKMWIVFYVSTVIWMGKKATTRRLAVLVNRVFFSFSHCIRHRIRFVHWNAAIIRVSDSTAQRINFQLEQCNKENDERFESPRTASPHTAVQLNIHTVIASYRICIRASSEVSTWAQNTNWHERNTENIDENRLTIIIRRMCRHRLRRSARYGQASARNGKRSGERKTHVDIVCLLIASFV